MVNPEHIESFWNWFVQNDQRIKQCIEDISSPHREYIIENLNNHILGMGTLTWDVGLDDAGNWFFMLSPNGNEDFLLISEEIINEAPHHLNWHFHASKPSKNWDRKFKIYNQEMDVVEVDASSWNYAAFMSKNNKIELVLEAANMHHLDDETALLAAQLFLTSEIGEKPMILFIDSLSVVPKLDDEEADSRYSVNELRDHLKNFL